MVESTTEQEIPVQEVTEAVEQMKIADGTDEEEVKDAPGKISGGNAKVYVRIRPHGTGVHAKDKEQVGDRTLANWTDQSITFDKKGTPVSFNYMNKVLGPDVDQAGAHEGVSAELLNAYLNGYNCTFLAYG